MTLNTPLVSVVVPCYNHEEFIIECIQSIVDQDYPNIELIVIDDGSKDGSVDAIKSVMSICENRFIKFVFIHRENKGLCKTLNEAIEIASGEYLCCVASDDVNLKDKISYQVDYMVNNPDSLGVFGGVEVIGLNKEFFWKPKCKIKFDFKDIYLHKHILLSPTNMLRLKNVKEVGGFNEDLLIDDWAMWLALTKEKGTLDCVEKIFAKYRRHDDNMSSKVDFMHQGRLQIIDFFKNKNYLEGLSNIHVIYAQEVSRINVFKSLKSLYLAVKIDCKIVLSRLFILAVVKIIIFDILKLYKRKF